jgi:UDP-N-acetylglucosamine/UDP-N-acetylgalactosamine diphosphorylase
MCELKYSLPHLRFYEILSSQVTFFQQGTLPCLDRSGRLIFSTPPQLATAPDGNGGVFLALKTSGCLEDMARRGVKYVDCFSVDNALVKVAEPTWMGHCIERDAAAGARVLKKAHPGEKVGVFVQRGARGAVEVVEYSEMDPAQEAATDPATGELRFSWSNVRFHFLR